MLESLKIHTNNTLSLEKDTLFEDRIVIIDSNDTVYINVKTQYYTNLLLFVEDRAYPFDSKNHFTHTFKINNYGKNNILSNYIGSSDVKIYNESNMEILYEFSFEINSSKITNEELIRMIELISSGSYKYKISNFISLAKIHLPRKYRGLMDIYYKIQALKEFLQANNIKSAFLNKTLKQKLNHEIKEERLKPTTNINKKGLRNIVKKTNLLNRSKPKEINAIKVSNKYYKPSKVILNKSFQSYDIYENQVLLGFITQLAKQIREFEDEIKNNKEENEGILYSSKKITEIFLNKMYDILNQDLKNITTELVSIVHISKRLYSDIKPIEKRLYITPLFKYDPFYKNVFRFVLNWNNNNFLPQADHNNDTLPIRINSIDKLFEYYCWEKIRLSFLDNGYQEHILNNKIIEYTKSTLKLTLYYTPIIKKDKSDIPELYLIPGTDKTTREPDYVLKIEFNNKTYFWILDAKYTNQTNYKRFTEIGYKYLLEISSKTNNDNKIIGASILTPLQNKDKEELHQYSFIGHFPVMSRYAFNILEENNNIVNHFETTILDIK